MSAPSSSTQLSTAASRRHTACTPCTISKRKCVGFVPGTGREQQGKWRLDSDAADGTEENDNNMNRSTGYYSTEEAAAILARRRRARERYRAPRNTGSNDQSTHGQAPKGSYESWIDKMSAVEYNNYIMGTLEEGDAPSAGPTDPECWSWGSNAGPDFYFAPKS
ncbi:uncharacterized protein IL334_002765 [Kwoniella shivajii]|uniref:Zn(2)-C6 fungal-type domain-containing protein n=1 Tax=Kwoniella shivajii TaxID=564305 RepID=A0ABZ1CVM2_9TREE|nr:hypothetical protein IL334_002765 [Kwoniella shivajii]